MKRIALFLSLAALCAATPAQAARKMDDASIAVLRMIDKLSARSSTFEVPVEKTVKFGTRLFIKVRACRKSSPLDSPENAAFLQIWEKLPGSEDSKWVFSGWMYASRPSASAMDNPVYDVWLIDCKSAATVAAPLTTEAAPASAPESGASKSSDAAASKSTPDPAASKSIPLPEKPASDAITGKEPEDSEAAPDEDTVVVPGEKTTPPAPVVKPPADDKKAQTPPPPKVFDPAAIRHELEENTGGGASDGEDAVSGPEEIPGVAKKDGKKN